MSAKAFAAGISNIRGMCPRIVVLCDKHHATANPLTSDFSLPLVELEENAIAHVANHGLPSETWKASSSLAKPTALTSFHSCLHNSLETIKSQDFAFGHMFNGFHAMTPTDAELATQTLAEEGTIRFHSFSASDAVTLVRNGLSLRKRFRQSTRHLKGKGLVISIQTITGHTLFACTVGDLGHPSGIGDVSIDSWACVEGMVNVVRRTGHSSFYVEKGMSAMGKTPKQMGIQGEFRVNGGAFPVWLENAPCCPIAVVACYSGSSQDDHNLAVTTIQAYLSKLARESMPTPNVVPQPENREWLPDRTGGEAKRTETPFEARDE